MRKEIMCDKDSITMMFSVPLPFAVPTSMPTQSGSWEAREESGVEDLALYALYTLLPTILELIQHDLN